jgi:hypothetical protein
MFTTTSSQTTHELQDMVEAWDLAARDVRDAWETWRASAPGARADAYVNYRRSLECEEHAAEMMAAAVR